MKRKYVESYLKIVEKDDNYKSVEFSYKKIEEYDYSFESNYSLNNNPDFDFFNINAVKLA